MTFGPSDLAIDRQLADLAASFRFLLDVSPVDLAEARERFLAGADPGFGYRPLDDRPDVLRERIDQIDCSALSDPIIASLFEARRRELALQVDMLEQRCTSEFLPLSIELYGAVSPRLVQSAEQILDQVDARPCGPCLDADTFAKLVDVELDGYRERDPDFGVHVEVRDDVGSVMVSGGHVLVPSTAQIPTERVEALIQHEVGTHAVTFVNGSRQPIHLLSDGLAGYEATQEGLAVFVEYLVDGLTGGRMRTLAGRVLAVHCMIEGAEFHETFANLRDDFGFSDSSAFNMTARTYRGGGLTKDAVYLKGLLQILDYVRTGQPLEVLWIGKMPLDAVPLIVELRDRGALSDPGLLPSFLGRPDVTDRINACIAETTVLDLVRSST